MASISRNAADEVFDQLQLQLMLHVHDVHQHSRHVSIPPKNKKNNDKQCETRGSRSTSIFLLDGGTGEELFRQGITDDRKIWSAAAVVDPRYHSVLRRVHRSFVDAGSQGITTNSYGIIPGVGFTDDEIANYVSEAGRLARESVNTSSRTSSTCSASTTSITSKMPDAAADAPLVFGSLGPLQESYRPDLILPHGEGVRIYSIMAAAMKPNVDCFLAETMSSYEESIQAVEAVATGESCMPMLVSYTLNSRGALRSGESVSDAVKKLLAFAKQHGTRVRGVLFNCSEPEAISIALKELQDDTSFQYSNRDGQLLLGAYANRLTPIVDDWTMATSDGPQPMRSDLSPHEYCTKFVSKWVNEYHAQLIGGCCGIGPAHIDYLRKQFCVATTTKCMEM